MDYFEVLGLAKEPFMDTADPYFFHKTSDRDEILTRLEVAVRVGRGLSIVLGDVGSGKTMLAQTLEHNLLQDENFVLGKIIDPSFSSEFLFLTQIAMTFDIENSSGNILELKNAIKNYLFKMVIEEGRTILLIIDEAQKLTGKNLETLRVLLNYQAPDRKLLNIILLGQPELMEQLRKRPNLADRVSSVFFLSPLDRLATHELIAYRLRQAGLPDEKEIFSIEAKDRIYWYSVGNVRKTVNLCHELIEELVIQDKAQVTHEMVEKAVQKRKAMEQLYSKDSKEEEINITPLETVKEAPVERTRVSSRLTGFFGRLLYSLNGL